MKPTILPLGDSALTVTFGSIIDEIIHHQVMSLFQHLKKQDIHGIKDVNPAYASLCVVYDVIEIKKFTQFSAYNYMCSIIEEALLNAVEINDASENVVIIPACYDLSLGTDLEELSLANNISIEEIIQVHSAAVYKVYMIGFLPGFAYMGTVDERIAFERKQKPVPVKAGSIGIAGKQTGIYPLNSPGGWNIIAQTPLRLFDVYKNQPCLFNPGDRVQFQQISIVEFRKLEQQ